MVIEPEPLTTRLPVALLTLMVSEFTVTPSTIDTGAFTAAERLYVRFDDLLARDTEPDTSTFDDVYEAFIENAPVESVISPPTEMTPVTFEPVSCFTESGTGMESNSFGVPTGNETAETVRLGTTGVQLTFAEAFNSQAN